MMTANSTPSRPPAIRYVQWLFYLNTAIWLLIGVYSLIRLYRGEDTPDITLLVVAVLMFGNAAAMLIAGWGLGLRNRWLYLFAIAVLLFNILLTFTDQFGIFDLLTLLLDLVLLILLWVNHRVYWLVV